MNKSEMKQIVLAIMHGDAFVDVNTNSGKARLDIYHCEEQKDYLLQKEFWLAQINGLQTHVSEKTDKRLLKSGNVRLGFRLQSSFSRYMYNLHVSPDKYKVKQLVKPQALAILWQDDGTICWDSDGNYSTAYLCTDSWERTFLNQFLIAFNNKYGWQPILMDYKCRGKTYPRLRFRKGEMIKLSNIIKSYVAPSMLYKIIP